MQETGDLRPDGNEGRGRDGDWQSFLGWLLSRLGLAIVAIGGALAFVAAVGGAIAWTRFRAVELPADQALDKLSQGELVAAGAVILALYGALGVIATAAVYLIDGPSEADDGDANQKDPKDRRSRGLSRGLLVLVAAEAAIITGLLVQERGWQRYTIAVELILAVLLYCLLITRAPTRWAKLGGGADPDHSSPGKAATAYLKRFFRERPSKERKAQKAKENRRKRLQQRLEKGEPVEVPPRDPIVAIGLTMQRYIALMAALTVICCVVAAAEGGFPILGWEWTSVACVLLGLTILVPGIVFGVRWMNDDGVGRPSPQSLYLTREGALAMIVLALAVIAAPALVMWEWWLAVVLAATVLFGTAAWVAALRTGPTAYWHGVVVFLSVLTLGALAGIVRNAADPQVQPLALVHQVGDELEGIEGIYVAESDDRIYYASLATYQCGDDVVDFSGRMQSVDEKQVVAMTLGPRQSVGEAGRNSREMLTELLPGQVAPRSGPRLTIVDDETPLDRPEPTLRHEFASEQELSDSTAAVGDTVVLLGDDFGDHQEGRRVRIGDLVAPLARTEAAAEIRASVNVTLTKSERRRKHWTNDEIRFTVPQGAKSGPVTLECPPLVQQLKLDVRHRPRAQALVKLHPDGRRVVLASRSAGDSAEKGIVVRRWRVGDAEPVSRGRVTADIAPQAAGTAASLRVVDDDGKADSEKLSLWRLPIGGAGFDFDDPLRTTAVEAIRSALVDREEENRLVIQAYAALPDGYPGSVRGLARQFAQELLAQIVAVDGVPKVAIVPEAVRDSIEVIDRGCAVDLQATQGVPVGRLDVLVVGERTRVGAPPGCAGLVR